MEKDEPEKSKLFMSHVALKENETEKQIKTQIKPSIYKIKIKKTNENLNQDNNSSKKELSNYLEGNKTIYEDNNTKYLDKNIKEIKNEINNENKGVNNRYNYYENKDGNEDYDISENNTPHEKPDKNLFIKKNNLGEKINNNNLQLSSELNKILQSTNKKDVKFLKEENENENMEKNYDEISNKKKERN